MKRLMLLLLVFVGGCLPEEQNEKLPVARAAKNQVEKGPLRFTVEAQGYFEGGYGGHKREIFIVTDRETGKQYLSITGAGVTELWTETTMKTDSKGNTSLSTETVEE